MLSLYEIHKRKPSSDNFSSYFLINAKLHSVFCLSSLKNLKGALFNLLKEEQGLKTWGSFFYISTIPLHFLSCNETCGADCHAVMDINARGRRKVVGNGAGGVWDLAKLQGFHGALDPCHLLWKARVVTLNEASWCVVEEESHASLTPRCHSGLL